MTVVAHTDSMLARLRALGSDKDVQSFALSCARRMWTMLDENQGLAPWGPSAAQSMRVLLDCLSTGDPGVDCDVGVLTAVPEDEMWSHDPKVEIPYQHLCEVVERLVAGAALSAAEMALKSNLEAINAVLDEGGVSLDMEGPPHVLEQIEMSRQVHTLDELSSGGTPRVVYQRLVDQRLGLKDAPS